MDVSPEEIKFNKANELRDSEKTIQFKRLDDVLMDAYKQAAYGKGVERHGFKTPFHKQPMQDLARLHGVGFLTGQASKKAQEAIRMPEKDRKIHELLGAINYLAGAIVYIQDSE